MADQTNPSQEEPKGGVFGSIQGAHSRDPEAAEEPVKEPGTTEPTEPAKEPGEAAKADDGKLGKALQRAAQLERQINQIGPWAQFGMAVGNDPKGKAIVDRYQKGSALFVGDEVEEEVVTTGQPEDKPLTRQEYQQEKAIERLAGELNLLAEEQLPNFGKVSRGQEFLENLDWAESMALSDRIPIDKEVAGWDNIFAAKKYTALKRAYTVTLASNPKILEAAKKAGEKQAKERAEEAAAVPSSTGTTTSSQEEPGEKTEAEESIDRMLNVRGRGKSFSTIGSK